jgi:hypothetical protein
MATPRPVELPGESGNPQVSLAVFIIEFRQRHAAPHQKFCPLPPPVRVNGFMILSSMILSLFVPFRVFPVSRGPELNPHRVQFFASTQAAACPRPCGQIRPNQTTFFTTGKNRIALAPLFTNRSGTSGDFIVTNLPNPGQA